MQVPTLLLTAAFLCCAFSVSHAEDRFVMAEDSHAKAFIVIGEGIDDYDPAVLDFVRVIAEMTRPGDGESGVALPLYHGEGPPEGIAQIHIGQTEYVKAAGLLPDSLPPNGYRIVTRFDSGAPKLVIVSTGAQGIEHGLYDLLSRELGCMWGMASPLFEEIPRRTTVAIGPIDRTEVPDFGFRVFSGVDKDWMRRNRIDTRPDGMPMFGGGHNLWRILPPSKYSDHPEYYAALPTDSGTVERRVPPSDSYTNIQPCFTNHDVWQITIDAVCAAFDEDPDLKIFSLCANDGSSYCRCEQCAALDAGLGEFRKRSMHSDSYWTYIDTVARAVCESHPDRFVSTYAYWSTEFPPRHIDKLPPNVIVHITQEIAQSWNAEYEQKDHEILERWTSVADHVAEYDYTNLGWYMPRLYTSIIARTFPYYHEQGLIGYYSEVYPHWANMGPMPYFMTRLAWDTSLDPDAVLDDWYATMFYESAGEVRAFYEELERCWIEEFTWTNRERYGKFMSGFRNLHLQVQYDPAWIERSWALINAAYNAAQSDAVRERIDYIRRGHRHSYVLVEGYHAAHALEPDTPELEIRVDEIMRYVNEGFAIFHTEIEGDQYYGRHYYSGEYPYGYIRWWKRDIAKCLLTALEPHPELRAKLIAEDAALAEMLAVAERK